MALTIRDVRGPEELRACQELQRLAWGISEDGYVVPVATMAAAQKVGGIVLGAFISHPRDPQTPHGSPPGPSAQLPATQDELAGFAFAFQGAWRGQRILYSQLTGVQPAHQSLGVGRALKREQRARARAAGLDAVVWAFDPLQAPNAAFNLVTLGAIARTYEVDLYGSRSDSLNAGLQTDRLMAEWQTASETPAPQTQAWPDTVNLLKTRQAEALGLQRVEAVERIPSVTHHVAIAVPASIGKLKEALGNEPARDWQTAVRAAFEAAFDAGFAVVGFSRERPLEPCYLLERTR
ncbi:MAG: GNAT family N-acetyltransferase [Chloroflexota bacterium]